MWESAVLAKRRLHLFLGGPSSALGRLAVVVHGGSSASRWLSILSPLRVKHPPWAFSCSLILYAHKAAVQGQIVSDGVLCGEKKTDVICMWSVDVMPQCKITPQQELQSFLIIYSWVFCCTHKVWLNALKSCYANKWCKKKRNCELSLFFFLVGIKWEDILLQGKCLFSI